MAEDTGDKREGSQQPKPRVLVSVDGNHLGHEIKAPKSSFNLSDMFSQDARYLGRDRFTSVYFRTDSGNIYMLNDSGQMVNGNESKRKGGINGVQLDTKNLERSKLTVGEPFRYGTGSNTTTIVEIVPVTDVLYDQNYLKTVTGGKRNTIREEFLRMLSQKEAAAAKLNIPIQERALAAGMLYGNKKAVTEYTLAADGSRVYTNRLNQNEYDALVKEFSHDPFTRLAVARENIRNIMSDQKLTVEQRRDRAKRYTDSYLKLTLELDHAAFPPDLQVKHGIPDYLPDGFVDMGSNPNFDPRTRSRDKIKIDKAKIFEQARPLFYKIFTEQLPANVTPENWEKWVIAHIASFVHEKMPYNYADKKHDAQYGRSITLQDITDQKLAQCRHHALMTQVLLQGFGIESRLMKSDYITDGKNLGPHANNAARVGNTWYILDSTNPEAQPDGTGKAFAKPIPEANLDLNSHTYQWDFKLANGKSRGYKSRSDMYWYIRDMTKVK